MTQQPETVIGAADMQVLEIEITSEMIDAGFQVLKDSGIVDDFLEADKCMESEIYVAMFRAHRLHKNIQTL